MCSMLSFEDLVSIKCVSKQLHQMISPHYGFIGAQLFLNTYLDPFYPSTMLFDTMVLENAISPLYNVLTHFKDHLLLKHFYRESNVPNIAHSICVLPVSTPIKTRLMRQLIDAYKDQFMKPREEEEFIGNHVYLNIFHQKATFPPLLSGLLGKTEMVITIFMDFYSEACEMEKEDVLISLSPLALAIHLRLFSVIEVMMESGFWSSDLLSEKMEVYTNTHSPSIQYTLSDMIGVWPDSVDKTRIKPLLFQKRPVVNLPFLYFENVFGSKDLASQYLATTNASSQIQNQNQI